MSIIWRSYLANELFSAEIEKPDRLLNEILRASHDRVYPNYSAASPEVAEKTSSAGHGWRITPAIAP